MRNKLTFIVLAIAAIAACSFAPKDIGRAYMFALRPADMPVHKPVEQDLTVMLPTAAPELDTYRIALLRDGGRWDYYAGARWPDFLPLIVQDNLTKTIADAQLFRSVNSDQQGRRADLTLRTDIRSFQAEYMGKGPPRVRIKMTVRLQNRGGAVLQSFDIDSTANAGQDKLSEIRAAFDRAFNGAQRQMVEKLQVFTPEL